MKKKINVQMIHLIANIITAIFFVILVIMTIINEFKSNDIIFLFVLTCALIVNNISYFTIYSSQKKNHKDNTK